MSGGSLDYLYMRLPTVLRDAGADAAWAGEDGESGHLEVAAARLRELGHLRAATAVGSLAADIRDQLRELAARVEELAPVLQAVEWRISGDFGDDAVAEAVAEIEPVLARRGA